MINTKNVEEAKRLLAKEQPLKAVLAQDDEFNRKILEYGGFDILLSIEGGRRKDAVRQTDSGLNHVLAEIARKNNIAIGIDLQEISRLDAKEKAERISKLMQNIVICRKVGARIAVKTKSLQKAKDFLLGLGASTNELKEAIVF